MVALFFFCISVVLPSEKKEDPLSHEERRLTGNSSKSRLYYSVFLLLRCSLEPRDYRTVLTDKS